MTRATAILWINLFDHVNIDKARTFVPDGLEKEDSDKACAQYNENHPANRRCGYAAAWYRGEQDTSASMNQEMPLKRTIVWI